MKLIVLKISEMFPILVKTTFSTLTVLAIIGINTIIGIDYCTHSKTRVQLCFVQDRTSTFTQHRPTSGAVAFEVAKDIEASFPGSQFALVSFADYDIDTVGTIDDPGFDDSLNRDAHAGAEDCYDPILKFTTNRDLLRLKMETMEPRQGGMGEFCESSLNGIVFAAASKTLGWNPGPIDSNGLYVHKAIVLLTDDCATRKLNMSGTRERLKLDGTDSCTRNLPPNNAEIRTIFLREDISLIGLYAQPEKKTRVRPFKFYSDIFDLMKQVRYSAYELNYDKKNQIISNIINGVHTSMECEDPDPPPYNTLGY